MQHTQLKTNGQLSTELSSLRLYLKDIEERDNLLFERNLAYSVVVRIDGIIENANKAFLTNLNYLKSEIVGQSIIKFIVEDHKKEFLDQLERCFEGQYFSKFKVSIYTKDRSLKTILFSSARLLFQDEKNPQSILVSGVDITVCKTTEEQLKNANDTSRFTEEKIKQVLGINQRTSEIFELQQLTDFIIEKATQVLGIQRCSVMILDAEAQEFLIKGARGVDSHIVANSRIKAGDSIAGAVIRDGNPILVKDIEVEPVIARKSSGLYKSKSFLSVPVKLRNKVVGVFNASNKGPTGEDIFTPTDLRVVTMIVQQAAITVDNANYCRELEHLSVTDSLTGLYNHRYFILTLRHEVERSKRYGSPLCLLMFDVDDFKSYNDLYGHLEGDLLLKEIARAVKTSLRVLDVVCRYGGDEFMIILPEVNILQVKVITEKIKHAIANLKLRQAITISIGIAACGKNCEVHDLMLRTDQGLYQAKKEGRDGICCLA